MKKRQTAAGVHQKGQAVLELAVSLIALMSLLIGFLLIAALTRENLRNVIEARKNADARARSGVLLSGSSRSILKWDYGKDQIPFTRDDTPETGNMAESADLLRSGLKSNSGELSFLSGTAGMPMLSRNSQIDGLLNGVDFFMSASELTSDSQTNPDPLKDYPLKRIEKTIKGLFGTNTFELSDSVYMPITNQYENNEL